MPVHIEEMTSDVAVVADELPLSEAQIDKLVALVLRRLEQRQRDASRIRDATAIRAQAAPRGGPRD